MYFNGWYFYSVAASGFLCGNTSILRVLKHDDNHICIFCRWISLCRSCVIGACLLIARLNEEKRERGSGMKTAEYKSFKYLFPQRDLVILFKLLRFHSRRNKKYIFNGSFGHFLAASQLTVQSKQNKTKQKRKKSSHNGEPLIIL